MYSNIYLILKKIQIILNVIMLDLELLVISSGQL